MGAEARLKELGLVLPELPKPVANYLPYRLAGNILYLAGQGPRDANGRQLTGKLGADVSVVVVWPVCTTCVTGCDVVTA